MQSLIHSVQYIEGQVLVTIALPEALLTDFKSLLQSGAALSNFVTLKAAHQKAVEKVRSEEFRQKTHEQYALFEADILKRYDKHVKSGLTSREAIKAVKGNSQYITCYQIELVCRKAGRLSKRKGAKSVSK